MDVSEVVSFRATAEEIALIERVRRQHGLETRADAVRFLLTQGDLKRTPFSQSPAGRFRIPLKEKRSKPWTTEVIDDLLYGDQLRERT